MLRLVMDILVAGGVNFAMCEGDDDVRMRVKKKVNEYVSERNMVVASKLVNFKEYIDGNFGTK